MCYKQSFPNSLPLPKLQVHVVLSGEDEIAKSVVSKQGSPMELVEGNLFTRQGSILFDVFRPYSLRIASYGKASQGTKHYFQTIQFSQDNTKSIYIPVKFGRLRC